MNMSGILVDLDIDLNIFSYGFKAGNVNIVLISSCAASSGPS
jgi:hypothetical protein